MINIWGKFMGMRKKRRFSVFKFVISLCLFSPVLYAGFEMYKNLDSLGYLDDTKVVAEDNTIDKEYVQKLYQDATNDLEEIKEGISSGDLITQEEFDGLLHDLGSEVDVSEFEEFIRSLMDTLGIN